MGTDTIEIPMPLILSQEDFATVVEVYGAAIENSEHAFEGYKEQLPGEAIAEVENNFARYRRIHGSLLGYVGKGSVMVSEMWTKEFFDKLVAWAQKGD